MAEAVEDIIKNGGVAFIEAGTGTGKSYGYGLPAVMADRRVVISTAKKALQEQLGAKDLPRLTSLVRSTPYSLLKGKSNYVCQLRTEEYISSHTPDARELDAVINAYGGTGELGSLNYPWLGNVRVNECVRMCCPHSGNCGYVNARLKAGAAQVLVVNHALLAHDLAVGGGKILGKYDTLIIDEGHQAPSFFREAYSLTLSPRQPEAMARMLKDSDFQIGDEFAHTYFAIFQAIGNRPGAFEMTGDLNTLFLHLYGQCAKIHDAMIARGLVNDEEQEFIPGSHGMARERAKLKAGGTMLGRVRKLCSIVLNLNDPEVDKDTQDWVKYTEKRGKDEMNLIITPLEVGPLVAPALLGLKSVVVTSATLAAGKGDKDPLGMGYMAREYGLALSQIRTQMVVPSPFDYKNRSALYLSKTAPDPATRGDIYYDAMCIEIHELLAASRGGALVLCASTDDMRAFHDGIYRKFHPMPYKLGMQTSASPESIIEWFKSDPKSVLVGLKTFWEGVDIPGDGLRLVIIPRLPFPPRGDVVLNARKQVYINKKMEGGDDEKTAGIKAWDAFDFQLALIDVKQGGGRLIRDEEDTGIVAILDRRAQGRFKGYAPKVRAALPHPQTEDKAGVLALLEMFADGAGV